LVGEQGKVKGAAPVQQWILGRGKERWRGGHCRIYRTGKEGGCLLAHRTTKN
jgi:hypothetical protein